MFLDFLLIEISESSGRVLRCVHHGKRNLHPTGKEEVSRCSAHDGACVCISHFLGASYFGARSSCSAERDSSRAERALSPVGADASAEHAADYHRAAQATWRGSQALSARRGEPPAQHRSRQERAHTSHQGGTPQTGAILDASSLLSKVSFRENMLSVLGSIQLNLFLFAISAKALMYSY